MAKRSFRVITPETKDPTQQEAPLLPGQFNLIYRQAGIPPH